jgi:hypothetical protein
MEELAKVRATDHLVAPQNEVELHQGLGINPPLNFHLFNG